MIKPWFLGLTAVLLWTACETPQKLEKEVIESKVASVIPVVDEFQAGQYMLKLKDLEGIVYDEGLEFEAKWVRHFMHDFLDFHGFVKPEQEWQGGKVIYLNYNDSDQPAGAYNLEISRSGVQVSAATGAGVFAGLQTLVQLLPNPKAEFCEEFFLPELSIEDAPRFQHRGLLLDCCRHFMSVDFIKEMIDHLAFYKMNVLHWHLTEDQGWRIAIDAYPNLTEHGAWRIEKDGSRYGGFYTKDEIREVVKYASDRHITIIPEIEMPGHSSAAISAYPWLGCSGEQIPVENEWGVFKDVYCAGNDSTLAFMRTVLDEVVELFPGEYIHIGGDEAPIVQNQNCDKCQRRMQTMGIPDEHALHGWFIAEMAEHLEGHGKTIIGWDEILEGGLSEGAIVQSWRGMEGGKEAVEDGHRAIMSPTSHCYLDYPLSSTDTEETFGFELIPEGISEDQAAMILGGEVNMWTEHAPQETVESKVFPRLLAMSEALWRSESSSRPYPAFKAALQKHYPMMDYLGIDYGFETVPLALETEYSEEKLFLQLRPAMEGIHVVSDMADSAEQDPNERLEVMKLGENEIIPSYRVSWRGRSYPDNISISLSNHLGVGKSLRLENGFSSYYPASGDQALCDGIRGSENFRDGHWQGLQGKDMIVILDMDSTCDIRSINTRYLQYNNAWIFLPEFVTFEFSLNGQDWNAAPPQLPQKSWKEKQEFTESFQWNGEVSARYIRVRARNIGQCPKGHDAEGSPAWLFCDEIVVR